ncbi:EcoRII N-terminal effector-binding domain-containing protein [Acinetobacter indicus]|uniref:EcoRII N-terminal effector-binding domain-containing protein n=1 Tax=Acinetobacter indicus TaxID=756892 RepID=UPI0013645E78|nr:EcoRII N-terminal effector-binding domain-containing protein [Acinetobacter indicus]
MKFAKTLSRNDLGVNGSHQSGFLVPKSIKNLLDFLPSLDSTELNPSTWIDFYDTQGKKWEFRYIYYNNKLHAEKGTRNEYRITWTTTFMKQNNAVEGDTVFLFKDEDGQYRIYLEKQSTQAGSVENSNRIKLSGWRQVY